MRPQSGSLKPEALSAALVGDGRDSRLLKNEGAIPPPEIGKEILQSYAGRYRSEGTRGCRRV